MALVSVLHREVLFGGAIYHMDDAADNYYPARVAFKRAISEGTLPAWEGHTMAGWPLIADPYYGYFYPLNFVFYLGPKKDEPPSGMAGGVPSGLGRSVVLHAFLAGLGMFIYLRGRRGHEQGRQMTFLAALFGAICFALSSFLVVRIRHIIYVQMIAWVPFLLAAIDRYIDTRRRLPLVACALCTALLLLAGAHSILHFAAMLIVAYTLARLFRAANADERFNWRFFTTTTAALGGAALCGALIAAVALLPTLLAMPQSARALGTDYSFASSYAWPSLRYLKLLWQPDAFGIGEWRNSSHPFRVQWNHWELAGYYQGVIALLLAIPGAIVGARRPVAERLALLLLCIAGILIALGDAGPLHPFLFKHLPLYAALRCPARALCMLVVAVPILAAHALDVGAGWLTRIASPRFSTALLALFCVITAADELRIDRGYVQPQPIDFAYGTERFSAVEWLVQEMPRQTAPARFVPDGRGPFRLLSAGETLGLDSASGYSSMLVWRYVHLLYIINHGAPYPYKQLRYDPAAAQISRFSSPLIDMLNVRYLISTAPPSQYFVERFRPPPGAPLHARYEPYWDPLLAVYENMRVLPRAYVAYQARFAAEESAEAAQVARPDFDPHREIVLGRGGAAGYLNVENRGRVHGDAHIISYARHHVVIEADAAAPGVLVLADTYFPGWSATVDGIAAPIRPVNLAQRGVPLAPGHHKIEFTYRSAGLFYGTILSLCGLLAMLGMLLLRRR